MPTGIYYRSDELKQKLRVNILRIGFETRYQKGKGHPLWKENVGYWGIHKWIVRNYGRANKCENCGTLSAKCYDWSNISLMYKRDIADWWQLCRSCHIGFDKKNKV